MINVRADKVTVNIFTYGTLRDGCLRSLAMENFSPKEIIPHVLEENYAPYIYLSFLDNKTARIEFPLLVEKPGLKCEILGDIWKFELTIEESFQLIRMLSIIEGSTYRLECVSMRDEWTFFYVATEMTDLSTCLDLPTNSKFDWKEYEYRILQFGE